MSRLSKTEAVRPPVVRTPERVSSLGGTAKPPASAAIDALDKSTEMTRTIPADEMPSALASQTNSEGATVVRSAVGANAALVEIDTVAKTRAWLGENQGHDTTLLVWAHELSAQNAQALRDEARNAGFRVTTFQGVMVVGAGASFDMVTDVLLAGEQLGDPHAQASLARTLGFLSARGIEIERDYAKGAVASYILGGGKIQVVLPSRVDLNTIAHETAHARLEKMQKRLTSWGNVHGYAIPYEIDGEPDAMGTGFGGFMNLLNELNAFRTGDSFDKGGASDTRILKFLHDAYILQEGEQAVADFSAMWTVDRVRDRSVPEILLAATRSLNQLSEPELLAVVEKGWGEVAISPLANFLRLAKVRYQGHPMPKPMVVWVRKLAEEGPRPSLRQEAAELLDALPADDEWLKRWHETRQAHDEFVTTAGRWMRRLQATGDFWPTSALDRIAPTLRFAAKNGTNTYEQTLEAMNKQYGDRFMPNALDGAAFAKVMATPGDTVDDKVMAFVDNWKASDFSQLWVDLANQPTEETKQLLLAEHFSRIGPAQIKDLFLWALDATKSPGLRATSLVLLKEVLERKGLRPLSSDLGTEAHAPRPAAASLLTPEIDQALAAAMFNGEPGWHRLHVIDLILSHTLPQELPALAQRVSQMLTDDSAAYNDVRMAAFFFLPEARSPQNPLDWGLALSRAVLADPTPASRALEFTAEHYRTVVAPALPCSPPLADRLRIDAALRAPAEAAIAAFDPHSAAVFRQATDDLWQLLVKDDERTRHAARYAIIANPVFVVGLKNQLVDCLRAKPSAARAEVVRLLTMLEPGFLPEADAVLAHEFLPTPIEAAMLAHR